MKLHKYLMILYGTLFLTAALRVIYNLIYRHDGNVHEPVILNLMRTLIMIMPYISLLLWLKLKKSIASKPSKRVMYEIVYPLVVASILLVTIIIMVNKYYPSHMGTSAATFKLVGAMGVLGSLFAWHTFFYYQPDYKETGS